MSILTKITYAFLFIFLLVHPHFLTGHVFSIPQAYAQSLTNLLVVGVALIVYYLHSRDFRIKEDEKEAVEAELQISSNKLIDAYKYIGVVNRRLPLLNNVTTGLLKQSKNDKRGKKAIIEDLLATATVSLAGVSWGMFRFVEVARKRTMREFIYTTQSHALLKSKISNSELIQLRTKFSRIIKVGDLFALSTSDDQAPVQCFFIFPKNESNIENELSTLQAIVDQAQIFYTYMLGSLENNH